MSRHKTLSKKNAYYLPENRYRELVYMCRQYPEWCKILRTAPDTSKAISYDKPRVQTSSGYDATAEIAMKRKEIAEKKKKVEQTVRRVAPELYKWLLLGVTQDLEFKDLEAKGIPCGKDMYYNRRRKFYFELSKVV